MSDIFAEATVTLVPDTKGFASALQGQLKKVIGDIEKSSRAPKIRVAPALTKDFIGSLRTQVDAAVLRAQKGVKPIRVSVALGALPMGQLREIQQASFQVQGAFTGLAAGADDFARSNRTLEPTLKRQNQLFAQGAVDLSAFSQAQDQAGKSAKRTQGAKDSAGRAKDKIQETRAERLLADARNDAAAATSTALNREQQLQLKRGAATKFARAEALATKDLTGALSDDARIRAQVVQANARLLGQGITDELNAEAAAAESARKAQRQHASALRSMSSEAGRAARAQAQLRRGALATSLSFLGIRGATLAASASFLAGAAAIAVFAKALDSATRFTDQLNVFRATTSATASQLGEVANAARALGADLSLPGVTAGDAAEAMTELAKAGLNVQQSIAGARGVLQLATAAAIDNAQAVELVANALNAFGLQGKDATLVADTFANAANAAQGSIVDIGIAFQQSAAAGRQVGLSFQDTSEFLTVLARAGLKGSDAGTSLRTALIRLINPGKEAAAALKGLGVQVRDAQGNLRPDIFIQLTAALKGVSPAQRDATIALIGGQDAFRAISILGRQSIGDFIRLRRELRQQGTAGELAAARMQGLRGSLEGLGNTLSTIGVRIGQGATPALQNLVDGVTSFAAGMAQSETTARTFAGTMDFVTLSLTGLGAALNATVAILGVVGRSFAAVTNVVGVPTLLAGLAVYKLFPPALSRVSAGLTATTGKFSRFLEINRRTATLFGTQSTTAFARFRIGLTQIARAFDPVTLGITAATAALVFLITRESEAERATRHLTEATNALVEAQQKQRDSAAAAASAGLGVNQARLGLAEAKDAAKAAAANVQKAAPGTFARTRAELELAVALDNVKIAQREVNKAVEEAERQGDVARNAAKQEHIRRRTEIADIREVARAQRRRALSDIFPARRPPEGSPIFTARADDLRLASARRFREELQKQIVALRQAGDADSLNLARRLQLINQVSLATKRIPDKIINIAINAKDFTQALREVVSRMGGVGREAQVKFLQSLVTGASPRVAAAIQQMIRDITSGASGPARDGGHKTGVTWGQGFASGAGETVANAVGTIISRAQGRLAGLQRQQTRLEIAGASPGERLANVRAQQAEAEKVLAQLEKNGASEGSINKQLDIINGIVQERRQIEAEIAANQKEAADKAKQAADDADQAALSRLERRRGKVQDRITDAQATETLADDLRANIIFRNLIRKQINRIKDLIKDRKTQIEAIRALQAIERDVDREITSLQKQRRQQIADRVAESIQLDISFAQTTGNRNAEIRARLREIARLKKLQDATKKGTVEYKRLRNLIAEQEQAIKDLRDAQKKKNDASASMVFQFLQAQSGFAANLLGNLIPQGATSGLVGVGSPGRPPGSTTTTGGPTPLPFHDNENRGPQLPGSVKKALATDTGAKSGGPTRGGQATEIHLLRQIKTLLADIKRGTGHPEAHYRRTEGPKRMDLDAHH